MIERPFTCFVLAPPGTDIAPLSQIVEAAGWSVLNKESISPNSTSYLALTTDLLRAASAVLCVLPRTPDPNTLVALGFSLGQERPVLLISTEVSSSALAPLSSTIEALPRVNATLQDKAAMQLHVTAFLDGLRTRPSKLPDRTSSRSIDKISPGALSAAYSLLERQVYESLAQSPEVAAIKSQYDKSGQSKYIPDFAIWLNDDDRLFGNPILIEVRGNPLRSGTRNLMKQVRNYALSSDARTVIVVHRQDDLETFRLLDQSPLTYLVRVQDFVVLLQERRLLDAMRLERNRFVHSAGQ